MTGRKYERPKQNYMLSEKSGHRVAYSGCTNHEVLRDIRWSIDAGFLNHLKTRICPSTI